MSLNVTELTEAESWEFLGLQEVGRLATAAASEPEIFPVNFATSGGRIFVRTAPGSKLAEVAVNAKVAFEADQLGPEIAYSVIVKGVAEILEHDDDLVDAEHTGLLTYQENEDSPKNVWLRITVQEISGRRFVRVG
ncbi:pyridoxamine 5'-phosphate oxidase-related FMN- binding protein [Xylanimonas cellulosilytica DSM 15894]|uniref:Pyridoxamine 5'-phosphate oxidase-related FMN-binding protein n=1 Tax=Xylanimonas cellulosilytica (strain DSM 15894 / JCM 12276 / CECT 5975 / KCTC 9989 / LMG 20990 / NBRC 107835 / XIL07) TaxID=446471 RepID=D1BVC1_XYLCX|nr:pyridoxamine 5'-phosphate oxidase family protein [Xylanimonas cellulosilytica]ACZ29392.1 pyridoxamine 5'-phosphate oxidase-related FMN- binding protein [Xylanimonas cellulosilytica DSM 15894]